MTQQQQPAEAKLKEISDQDMYEALKKFDLERVGTSFTTKPLDKLSAFARQMYRHFAMDMNQYLKHALKARNHTWADVTNYRLTYGPIETDSGEVKNYFKAVCQVRGEFEALTSWTFASPQIIEELSCIVRL